MAYSIDSLESADNTSVFEVSATLAERLAGGVYAVYVLDTRVTPAVQTDGSADEIRIVVPKTGSSGFYRVIRN